VIPIGPTRMKRLDPPRVRWTVPRGKGRSSFYARTFETLKLRLPL
jgi:hypothetical protein